MRTPRYPFLFTGIVAIRVFSPMKVFPEQYLGSMEKFLCSSSSEALRHTQSLLGYMIKGKHDIFGLFGFNVALFRVHTFEF